MDSYFTIDGMEGTIATNELLDRENTAQYNFSIIASKVSKYNRNGRDIIWGIVIVILFVHFDEIIWQNVLDFFCCLMK